MNGYSYSVWYVPYNYTQIQYKYQMSHVPHVTVKTNLATLEDAYRVFDKYVKTHPIVKIKLVNELIKFPSFYTHDPLQAYGWYVNIKGMEEIEGMDTWKPHMSMQYQSHKESCDVNVNVLENSPIEELRCFLAIADTRSSNPSHWQILSNAECQ
jgi:hypothetical protein